MRRLRIARLALPLVLAISVAPRLGAQSACDRACLADVMTRYLASLVAHDPKQAPIAQLL
jgi:hypothetical protein